MRRSSAGRLLPIGFFACLVLLSITSGCTPKPSPDDKPAMSAGTGAIEGKLVSADHDAFDLSKIDPDSPSPPPLKIELISPSRGVVATTTPREDKPNFRFENVRPGTYELSVYRVVPGKRTIAGSVPLTVNAEEVSPVTLVLQVTEETR